MALPVLLSPTSLHKNIEMGYHGRMVWCKGLGIWIDYMLSQSKSLVKHLISNLEVFSTCDIFNYSTTIFWLSRVSKKRKTLIWGQCL